MLTAPPLSTFGDLTTLKPVDPPVRKIYSAPDLEQWTQSDAYDSVERFIKRLGIASSSTSDPELGKPVLLLVDFLTKIASWIEEPEASATPNKSRAAFQAWLDRLVQAADDLHRQFVDDEHAVALPELRVHLQASFGSQQRLDYGTGHELSFLAYLLVLRRTGILSSEDEPAVARRVFADYLSLIRKVQAGFKLEPAGKLGVWGLDEHQHLVYHWGASQARIHPSKRPVSLLAPPNASPNRIAYLFLSTLLHLNHDPSAPAATAEEDAGLFRLYRAEVLQRLPVVQHLRFGAVLRWVRAGSDGEPPGSEAVELPSTGDGLDPAAQEALSDVLDQRVRDDGTVAPWALPALSGQVPAAQMLERLPSPPATGGSRSTGSPSPSRGNGPPTAPSPVAWTSPLPSPVPFPPGGGLGPRRASRLSISASYDDET